MSESMSSARRRFLLIDQGLVVVLVTAAINAGLAWLMMRKSSRIPLFGGLDSVAADVVATSFFLPYLTCLISTPFARKQVANAGIPKLGPTAGPGFLRRLADLRARSRGLRIGLVGVLVFAPLVIAGLWAAGFDAMTFAEFLTFKTLLSAAMAAVVGPLCGYWVLAERAGEDAGESLP